MNEFWNSYNSTKHLNKSKVIASEKNFKPYEYSGDALETLVYDQHEEYVIGNDSRLEKNKLNLQENQKNIGKTFNKMETNIDLSKNNKINLESQKNINESIKTHEDIFSKNQKITENNVPLQENIIKNNNFKNIKVDINGDHENISRTNELPLTQQFNNQNNNWFIPIITGAFIFGLIYFNIGDEKKSKKNKEESGENGGEKKEEKKE